MKLTNIFLFLEGKGQMFKDLYSEVGIITRRISAENPTGEKGGACRAEPNAQDPDLYYSKYSLGKGWKVRPFIRMAPHEKVIIADIVGSGEIVQLFLTSDRANLGELMLRMYWDNEEIPSVDCPMGAFFCMGHDGCVHTVISLPVTVAPYKGMNAYWRMPFRTHARIEVENCGNTATEILAYKVLYHIKDIPEGTAYFHAQYRTSVTTSERPVHTILDGVRGKGVYVGTYLAWTGMNSGWWGEGEVKFYLDGDTEYPTICDNGTEDYFGGAWNFGGYGILGDKPEQEFNSPYLGMPYAYTADGASPKKFSLYRFHIEDGIGFSNDIKVTVDTIGWEEDRSKYKHLSEKIASVAFLYQTPCCARVDGLSESGDCRKK